MDVKASGRAAVVVAVGLLIGLAGLEATDRAQAAPASGTATTDKPAVVKPHATKKPAKHSVAKSEAAKSEAAKSDASKSDASKIAAAKSDRVGAVARPKAANGQPMVEPVPLAGADAADVQAPLPDTVANANAQMADAAGTQPVAALDKPADSQLVASDQLNDVDLASTKEAAPPQTTGQSAPIMTAMAQDDTLWRQTSLIGKIFIAFGGLLTIASAARMFIA